MCDSDVIAELPVAAAEAAAADAAFADAVPVKEFAAWSSGSPGESRSMPSSSAADWLSPPSATPVQFKETKRRKIPW